jgi:predicted amidohydrolase
VLLTPEGSLSGYTHEFDREAVEGALEEVTAAARAAGVGLALGTCFVEPGDGRCYNQLRFYSKGGDYLGFHAKTLVCGSLEEPPEGEIDHYATAPLRTFEIEGVPVGGLVCNDLWANPTCTPMDDPHLTQKLAGMGARVILHAVNGGRGDSERRMLIWKYHEANIRMRAIAGRLWIVTVDSSAPVDLRCSTPCGVVNPEGEWVVQTRPVGADMFAHTIEISGPDPG